MKHFLKGGNEQSSTTLNIDIGKRLQTFIVMVISGYFGVKIIYQLFFKFYPDKYYYRNVEIPADPTLTEEEFNEDGSSPRSRSLTINAYVPGMWNTEITDFVTCLVMSFVAFIFCSGVMTSVIKENGTIHSAALFGYILGLGYPVLYENMGKMYEKTTSVEAIRYIYLFIVLGNVALIVALNYSSGVATKQQKTNYFVYFLIIVLFFYGVFIAKNENETNVTAKYFYNKGERCTFKEDGKIIVSKQSINATMPFVIWIMLFLFTYEPADMEYKFLYLFLFGVLLGVFVSSISYFGIQYMLSNKPEKVCVNDTITSVELSSGLQEEEDEEGAVETTQTRKISPMKLLIIALILGLLIYFIGNQGFSIGGLSNIGMTAYGMLCLTIVTAVLFIGLSILYYRAIG